MIVVFIYWVILRAFSTEHLWNMLCWKFNGNIFLNVSLYAIKFKVFISKAKQIKLLNLFYLVPTLCGGAAYGNYSLHLWMWLAALSYKNMSSASFNSNNEKNCKTGVIAMLFYCCLGKPQQLHRHILGSYL